MSYGSTQGSTQIIAKSTSPPKENKFAFCLRSFQEAYSMPNHGMLFHSFVISISQE